MKFLDLRSDTLTKPSQAMREAILHAEVGDDVYGEDPSVNKLQEYAASLLKKEAALFVPSGSMANQISLLAYTRPGDDVIIGKGAHNFLFESGAGGAIGQVQFSVVGNDGIFSASDMEEEIKPDNHHFAPTRLVCIENTHNRGGGKVFPLETVKMIRKFCQNRSLPLHMDGARLFNAQVASNIPAHAWADEVDSLSICLSKGLGAPVGSLVLGTKDFIWRCHRYRKMLGGGMRQAGILAAAGLFALQNNISRLKDDHLHAKQLAKKLSQNPTIKIDSNSVETNIVIFEVPVSAAEFAKKAREKGVGVNAVGARKIRAVTHLDIDQDGIDKAASLLNSLAKDLS